MSQFYGLSITIDGPFSVDTDIIQEAAEVEWPFRDWYTSKRDDKLCLTAYGESSLGGRDEEQAATIAKAVWKANGGFCRVSIDSTYLEDLPYDTYEFDEDAYEAAKEDNVNV